MSDGFHGGMTESSREGVSEAAAITSSRHEFGSIVNEEVIMCVVHRQDGGGSLPGRGVWIPFPLGFRQLPVDNFADEGCAGTCLRAANSLFVGRMAGRGRQDRTKRHARTVKTVFMFPFDRRRRRELGVPHVKLRPDHSNRGGPVGVGMGGE